MKIMVAQTGGVIATHFAHAHSLDLYEVDEETHNLTAALKHDFSNYEAIFEQIQAHGVDKIIVGAIGLEAIEHLIGRGLDVYYGFAHTAIKEAITKVYQGRVPKGNANQETFDCHE